MQIYTQGTADGTAVLLFGVYKEENNVKSLVDVAISDKKTITGGATIAASVFSASLTKPALDEGATYYACAYVWEETSSRKPLAEKFILNQATIE